MTTITPTPRAAGSRRLLRVLLVVLLVVVLLLTVLLAVVSPLLSNEALDECTYREKPAGAVLTRTNWTWLELEWQCIYEDSAGRFVGKFDVSLWDIL